MIRPLPHDPTAEQAIISSILLRPEVIDQVVINIQPTDCYVPAHQRILGTAYDLHTEGLPVDTISLLGKLDIKDVRYLSELPEAITIENVDYYCQAVKGKATLRRLIGICNDISSKAYTSEDDPEELLSDAFSQIQACYRSGINTSTLRELSKAYVDECERRFQHPDQSQPLGVTTGFPELDSFLVFGGLPRGHVSIIAAETSKGKSALAQAFMRQSAQAGQKVLHITLEDRAKAVTGRQLSAISGIQNMQIQKQIIGPNEWFKFMGAAKEIYNFGHRVHFIDEKPGDIDELCSLARRHIQQEGADLTIFDYLQLIPSGKAFRRQQEHTDYVFDAIQRFSGQHPETAVLLVSQMARHEGRPMLNKLYHSAKLEQGAHTVMLIWSPEIRENLHCTCIDIQKQKDGPVGLRVLGWDGRTVRFFDADEVDKMKYMEIVQARV